MSAFTTSGRPAVALQFFLSRNKRSHPSPTLSAARWRRGEKEVTGMKVKTNVKGGGIIFGD